MSKSICKTMQQLVASCRIICSADYEHARRLYLLIFQAAADLLSSSMQPIVGKICGRLLANERDRTEVRRQSRRGLYLLIASESVRLSVCAPNQIAPVCLSVCQRRIRARTTRTYYRANWIWQRREERGRGEPLCGRVDVWNSYV